MKGDRADFVSRLRLTLPDGWFGDIAPVLGGFLSGLAAAWATLFTLLQTVRSQSRLATTTDSFLDLACIDYFGGRVARRMGEVDAVLRTRLLRAMQRDRATRAALTEAAAEAGYEATIFEPARPSDTGAYSMEGGLAWGVAGGWGSLQMPLECLVTVHPLVPVADIGAELASTVPAGGVAWIRVSD